jgi:hypothetical protein
MAYAAFVMKPVTGRDIILKPQPRPVQPIRPTAVPEGGSTLWFILAALTAVGWAAIQRHSSRIAAGSASRA